MGPFRLEQPVSVACELLFVYGTLKRGLTNHHQLGGAPFLGEAELAGVRLHDLGPFPMAIAADGLARGELYRVDEVTLARLDRFEGVPRLYRRECRSLADGRQVWIYLGTPRQVRHSPLLPAGLWPAADSTPSSAPPSAAKHQPACPGVWSLLRRWLRRPPLPACGQLSAAAACPGAWRPLALLAALLASPSLSLQEVHAEVTLAQCRRWQRSSGQERIRLGNVIGAAAYLTKTEPFAEIDPQQPRLLYAPTDLQRACAGWD